ncbi:VWD domain-containing protein [Roseofilum sp. BLCC_M91]|uniref:VWD domain-containing protein n=1 Tax=Roseofilum halophilum BLCC-M91 TaxID=3022259 RepID=A0ABT7BNT7_9CYAN|nr:VWD domain-containing protein [Roseofilum halophilum]MDJ1180442.1 VWD domain-containing protein [Roseofilum halophilum BLCC-M91]
MRLIKYLWFALISFVLVLGSAWIKRSIAVALCGILGFNSNACFWAEQNRAVAIQPPAYNLAQGIDIFRNDGEAPPPQSGGTDIFRNDGGSSPPPPAPSAPGGIDIFRNPDVNQPNSPIPQPEIPNTPQSQVQEESLAGIWLYAIYDQPLANEPVLITSIRINEAVDRETEELEYSIQICDAECDRIVQNYDFYPKTRTPHEQSAFARYQDLTLQTVDSLDGQQMWGELNDTSTGEYLYFTMLRIVPVSSQFGKSLKVNPIGGSGNFPIPGGNPGSNNINNKPTTQNPNLTNFTKNTKNVDRFDRFVSTTDVASGSQKVQAINRVEAVDNNSVKNWLRSKVRKISDFGKSFFCKSNSKCIRGKIPSISSRSVGSALRGSRVLRVALKGARLGLRVAGKLAIPLLILDLALTAYEFCLANPDTCKRIGENIAQGLERFGNLLKGSSYGDPHLVTFDGFRYSFQTVGEFILAKSVGGDFEVQTRQGAIPGRDVSLNTGAAMKIGRDRIAFYSKFFPDSDTSTPLRVNGRPTRISGNSLSLPGGGAIYKQGGRNYLVKWPSGEEVAIRFIQMSGSEYMNVTPHVLSSPPGQFTGLLGNLNGNPGDDLRTRSGNVLPSKSSYGQVRDVVTRIVPIPGAIPVRRIENAVFNQLYKNFGNSWRISQSESLFDYAPGQTTETFTDKSFPRRYKTMDMLSAQQIREAEQTCLEAGVEPDLLEGCIFDVGFTGDRSFAQAAASALNIIDQLNDIVPGGVPIPRPRLPIPIPGLPF